MGKPPHSAPGLYAVYMGPATGGILLTGVLVAAIAAAPPAPPARRDAPAPPRANVLLFSRTVTFRHESIPTAVAAIRTLGAEQGLEVSATEDAAVFTDAGLSGFDTVVFLSTTGDVLNLREQAAFERYVHNGGGYVGIHAAADTEYDWPWYGRLVGAYFKSHPAVQDAVVEVVDGTHPSTSMLPHRWSRRDEWYDYRSELPGTVHVLLSLDERSYEGGSMGNNHPIAWCHDYDGGRSWYTGGGHTIESWSEALFLEHVRGGILWAAGTRRVTSPPAPQ